LLRGRDVQELKELQRQGMSIQAISELTGWDRKTIRKYVQAAGVAPEYGPRPVLPSKLDAFKPYLEERLRAGVWNARVLLRELRERNYAGGYTILTDWLRPQRSATRVVAVRRFETAPGKQAQVDWGHLGTLEMAGQEQKLHGFTFLRWVTAEGWWRKRRWTKNWARCCGCTKQRSSRSAECRKRFSTTA
jgi:transposase